MTWFRVDDSFSTHPKVVLADLEARGLWITAGAWCSQHLTDGRISTGVLRKLVPHRETKIIALANSLKVAGLWDLAGDEWVFHDWADYNPTKDQVLADRQKQAQRQRDWYRKHRRPNGVTNSAPTRPDPTRPLTDDADPLQGSAASSVITPGSRCEHGAVHSRLCALCRRQEPTDAA